MKKLAILFTVILLLFIGSSVFADVYWPTSSTCGSCINGTTSSTCGFSYGNDLNKELNRIRARMKVLK